MAKKATITPVTDTVNNASAINQQLNAINNQLENTLSLDGSVPNAMGADIDLNDNDLLNVKSLDLTGILTISGVDITDKFAQASADAASAAQDADDAAASEVNAAESAVNAALYDPTSRFITIADMAPATGLQDGEYSLVQEGFNGKNETFQYDAASTATADGALIVTATGMGG